MDAQRGIRKPAVLDAALSFRTVYRPAGAERPYEDAAGDDGLIRYKYRGTDPQHPENRALRAAMHRQLPLIWFFGVGTAQYLPTFPVFVVGMSASKPSEGSTNPSSGQPSCGPTPRDALCVHLGTVNCWTPRTSCPTETSLGSRRSVTAWPCARIHHAAFDAHILGVRPDHVIEIRQDLLEELDGPMFRHGLQEVHGRTLMVLPSSRKERPDSDLLEVAYQRFVTAG
ncbi:HNH endonuclease [soil metagenome]